MAVVTAARFGERSRAVITEAAQAFVEEQTIQSIASAKLKFRDSGELAKLQRYHGSKARWVVDAWTDTWLNPQFRDWSLELELPTVRSPLLAIHGDADEYGSIEFPKTLSTKTGGSAQMLILEACGHVPHRERESEVLDAVANFVNAGALGYSFHRNPFKS
jgi:pimeloyl-ACP methyl ester carboxylesterase